MNSFINEFTKHAADFRVDNNGRIRTFSGLQPLEELTKRCFTASGGWVDLAIEYYPDYDHHIHSAINNNVRSPYALNLRNQLLRIMNVPWAV